ncbi:hypothetical protein GJ496_001494 [Pomphorhynchus laevis]|nr:hypothetical protein GJ496_001494 [Pomphorhynchus laevis]
MPVLYDNIDFDIEALKHCGFGIESMQYCRLQISMEKLKNEANFKNMYFWGRFNCVEYDYMVIEGRGFDELRDRTFFISNDECLTWNKLTVTSQDLKSCLLKTNTNISLSGNPELEITFKVWTTKNTALQKPIDNINVMYDGCESPFEILNRMGITYEEITVKEELVLAFLIEQIDSECNIVPRKSYIKRPDGIVVKNPYFKGLSNEHSLLPKYYQCFREKLTTQEAGDIVKNCISDFSIDFMPSISFDTHCNGKWAMHAERSGNIIIGRHLKWIGSSFYHLPNSCRYGSVYNGSGYAIKNASN